MSVQFTRTVVIIHAWPRCGVWSQRHDDRVDGPPCACQRSSAVPVLHVFLLVLALGDVRGGDLGRDVFGFGCLAVESGDGV